MRYFDLDDVFTFGKYKGTTLREVAAFNPSYISWCLNNIAWFQLTDSVIEQLIDIKP